MKKIQTLFVAATFIAAAGGARAEESAFRLGGDFRYRHETIHNSGATPTSQHNHRIRARVGGNWDVNETSRVEMRLSTPAGRASTNQTLGASTNGFANYAITLDRFGFMTTFADKALEVRGGRLPSPYFTGGSDLIWDGDLNFDGLSATYTLKQDVWSAFLTGTFYWVDNLTPGSGGVAATAKDRNLMSAQAGGSFTAENGHSVGAGAAFHRYTNMNGQSIIGGTSTGNTSSGGNYVIDFGIIDLAVEARGAIGGQPAAVTFNYVTNPSASAEKDGFLAGVGYGKVRESGDWSVGYDYRQLKADAAPGAFSESDSWSNGGTSGKGHRFLAAYGAAKGVTASITFYAGKQGISGGAAGSDRKEGHFDVVYRF